MINGILSCGLVYINTFLDRGMIVHHSRDARRREVIVERCCSRSIIMLTVPWFAGVVLLGGGDIIRWPQGASIITTTDRW
jgi:hypothetical protein